MKKNMKRITFVLSLFIAALLICSMLSACGAKSQEPYSVEDAMNESTSFDYGIEAYDAALEGTEAPLENAEANDEFEQKIIRNADVSMEADDAKECYSQLLDYAKKLGGYESSSSTSSFDGSDYRETDISAVIKLPPEALDDFISKIGELGDVTYCNVSSDEITEEYYDAKIRLESKEAALESYYELLEKAETMEDVIRVQNSIDELTEEIEALKGRLRLYDSAVSMSTVTLNIYQSVKTDPSEKEFEWNSLDASSFGKIVKNGFLGVTNFLWTLLQWIAIILLSASPLILAAIVIIIIWRVRRKKHIKKDAEIIEASGVQQADSQINAQIDAPTYGAEKND